jgi:phosphatidylserine decarboxylase
MVTLETQSVLPAQPVKPSSVQPGGGWCMSIELAWGRLRRAWLRRFRPGYVRRMAEKRQGHCDHCPHDIIDPRDLKYYRNVCGYWFRPEDDRFRWRDRLGFARPGLAELLIFSLLLVVPAVLLGVAGALWHWSLWLPVLPLVLVWLEVIWFFRDPQRHIPDSADVLVSAADGTITHVGEVEESDFPGSRAFRISIFLSIFNVHVNRIPRTARVVNIRYFPGEFLDARHAECAVRNEQLWIDLEENDSGRPLRVKQISGAIARRIVCWLKEGETVRTGERLGMIKFGSRTEVLLPASAVKEVRVKVGDKVKGGSTILLTVADRTMSSV